MDPQIGLYWGLVGASIMALFGLLAARAAARRAQDTMGKTLRAASAIVSEGLAASDPFVALGAMTESLGRLLDADVCVIALPGGDGHLRLGGVYGYPDPALVIKDTEGMAGRAFTSGIAVVAPDVSKDPDFLEQVPGIHSAVAVPMRYEGRVRGVFNLESRTRTYTERDLAVLDPLADQIAAVLANLELRKEAETKAADEQRARMELEAVSSVVMAGVAAVNDLDAALDSMIKEIAATTGWESMVVILVGDDGLFHPRAAYGYPRTVMELTIHPGQGIAGTVAVTGVGRRVSDVERDPLYRRVARETRSEMCVPLTAADGIVGVLNAESPRLDAFSEDDFRVLGMLAEQMAIVIERARLTDLERVTLERLRDLDQLRDDFVATVSHELRTPLTSIKGFAKTMLEREEDIEVHDRRALLERMVHQCNRLGAIVETLLLVSRVEAGEIGAKPTYVVVKDLLREAADAANAGDRLTTDVEPGCGLVVDHFRAFHIIRNLIENACKYSSPGAQVLVRAATDDGDLLVEVLDQGRGIPSGSEEVVFDRFRRLSDPGLSGVPGTGLGLYISRRFAQDLGGDLAVKRGDRPPWLGARFVLRLPGAGEPAVPRTTSADAV
jgi:signal transduction histidine kinase